MREEKRAVTERRAFAAVLVTLYAILFFLQNLETLREDRTPEFDAQQYVTIAWNIAHHGTVSLSPDVPGKPVWPTMHRPPAYPFILAMGILVSPDLRSLDLAGFFKEEAQPRLAPLRRLQVVLRLAVSFLAMGISWALTRSRVLAFLTLGLAGLDTELIYMSGLFLSENLACFLLTALSLCLALAVRSPGRLRFGSAGALLAALALTRPAYAQLVVVLTAFFLLLRRRRPARQDRIGQCIVIFLVCFTVPVGVWVARNFLHFGKAGIATGSGVVLDIRSRLNLMNAAQYAASFLYWSESRYLQEVVLPRHFDEQTVAFLDETSPGGAYQQAHGRINALVLGHGSIEADGILRAEAEARLLAHPWRHLAVTLPVALRGSQVHGPVVSLLLFGCLAGGFVLACLRRDAVCVAALLPSVFSFAFHAFLTQNIARFSNPLLPVLWAALGLVLAEVDRPACGGTDVA